MIKMIQHNSLKFEIDVGLINKQCSLLILLEL